MVNAFFSAKLIDYSTIKVFIFSEVQKPEETKIKLIKDGDQVEVLTVVKQSFINGLELYECKTKKKLL